MNHIIFSRILNQDTEDVLLVNPEGSLPAGEEDSGPLARALIQDSAGKNLVGCREWLTT